MVRETWKLIFIIINTAAIPVAAFLIRMIQQDVHNDDEKVISYALRALVANLFGGKERPAT